MIQGLTPFPENYVKDCSEDGACSEWRGDRVTSISLTWQDEGNLSREGCHWVLGVTESLTLRGIETKYGGSNLRICLFLLEFRDLVAICRGSGVDRVKEGALEE